LEEQQESPALNESSTSVDDFLVEAAIRQLESQPDPLEGLSPEMILGAVHRRAVEVEEDKKRLDSAVALARAAGLSWTKIGKAVGISQQAANSRWDPAVKQKRAEYQRRQNRARSKDDS
jgi:hypothetical protein